MPESIVIYRENQALLAEDLDNSETWTQDAIDHIVLDALISTDKVYAGFALSKVDSSHCKTSPGRLYVGGQSGSPNAGAVYGRDEEVVLDLYNDLPQVQKRYFAIVAWGTTVDDDIQSRNFVIDADTGEAEPQSVAMRRRRYCNINYIKGVESADPQRPSVDATQTLIGYVYADPTGIVSYEQNTGTQIDNLRLVAVQIRAMSGLIAFLSNAVSTLRTDLANLAKQLLLYTPLTEFQKLVDLVNWIYAKVNRPATYIFYGSDKFFDTSQSDTTNTTLDSQPYNARIQEGLRFPGGGTGWTGTLSLNNASEPTIQSYDDFILPKPSGSRIRYDCSFPNFPWISERILVHPYWNFSCRHLTWGRHRHRCGPHFLPAPDVLVWWYQAQLDPVIRILSFAGETWETLEWKVVMLHDEDDVYWPRHWFDRWKYYWRDGVHRPYWAKIYTDFSHSGNHVAQTFFNAQDGWLSGITLFSHKPAFYQPLTLVISGCDAQGRPDHGNHTLRRVVLDATSIQACYGTPILAGDIVPQVVYIKTENPDTVITSGSFAGIDEVISVDVVGGGPNSYYTMRVVYGLPIYVVPLRINFPPVFLQAGQHIAIHCHSTFDHEFSICDQDVCYQTHQGHFWHYDGSYGLTAWLTSPKTLRFVAHFATWGRWGAQTSPGGGLRYEVELTPLQLAGGIGAIDVIANLIEPPATDLSYEIQVGGIWKKFDFDPNTPTLDGSQSLVRFRLVFTGTTDLMPGISLENSEVTLTRGATNAFRHISTDIPFGSPTNSIKVVTKMTGYVEAHHDLTLAIHYGGTHKTADSVAPDEVLADGTIVRTATFNVSSVSTCKVELTGASDGVGDRFMVSERIIYCT